MQLTQFPLYFVNQCINIRRKFLATFGSFGRCIKLKARENMLYVLVICKKKKKEFNLVYQTSERKSFHKE